MQPQDPKKSKIGSRAGDRAARIGIGLAVGVAVMLLFPLLGGLGSVLGWSDSLTLLLGIILAYVVLLVTY